MKTGSTLRLINSILMLSYHLRLGLQSGLNETGHLEEIGVDERTTLKWILKQHDGRGRIR
jgi:hypothetical protein